MCGSGTGNEGVFKFAVFSGNTGDIGFMGKEKNRKVKPIGHQLKLKCIALQRKIIIFYSPP